MKTRVSRLYHPETRSMPWSNHCSRDWRAFWRSATVPVVAAVRAAVKGRSETTLARHPRDNGAPRLSFTDLVLARNATAQDCDGTEAEGVPSLAIPSQTSRRRT